MQTIRTVFTVVAIFLVTALLAVFAWQNSEAVKVTFLRWEVRYPVFFVLLLAALGGTLLTSFVGLFEVIRMQSELRKTRRIREMLEREVDALRNQPLFEEPAQPERTAPRAVEPVGALDEATPIDLPPSLKRENIG